ncbi:MAG: S46 family peptidase [Owenweeksia sp.]
MKLKSIVIILLAFISLQLQAKEGMWIPYLLSQLNQDEMVAMGLEITAEDIYSVNHSSIKDAIVHFNGGCTAEIISNRGLLLTNHHCGYSQIQSHSSIEKNYLKDGFWAMSGAEELKNSNLTASIVIFMEDVTNEVMGGVTDKMTVGEREKLISENIAAILDKRNASSEYDLEIEPFFYGNQYILIAKETFRDVRLVGAPPSSIGKFGADTDNWMWPRHTGDFSVFRIYAGPDNKPAEVSENNVPYTPNYHLKVNISGIEENDFSMIYGFPGRTQEYLPSNEVRNTIEVYDPAKIDIRDKLLKILDRKMRLNDATRIQYASKYASISNAWKKWIGEIKGIKETNGVQRKVQFENQFSEALNNNPDLRQKYGDVLDELKKLYEDRKPVMLERYHYIEIGYYGIELMRHMLGYRGMVELYENDTDDELENRASALANGLDDFYKDYDIDLDRQAMQTLLPIYLRAVSTGELPEIIRELKQMESEDLKEYIDELYEDLIVLEDPVKFREMLNEKPGKAAKKIMKSEAYKLSSAMYEHFLGVLNSKVADINNKIDYYQGQYILAMREVFPMKRFYPDANSTLRVAYGKVEPYEPRDAVYYDTQTFLSGVIAKYVPGDYEFDLPQKLIDLYKEKDFEPYGQDDKMPVCYIASNHTTGGNSGSPALNSRGELVGLNFDRVWEGTMSDINYDISRCRNIMVDVRYVLFIMDKFAGAKYLVDEMDLVYDPVVNKDMDMKKSPNVN